MSIVELLSQPSENILVVSVLVYAFKKKVAYILRISNIVIFNRKSNILEKIVRISAECCGTISEGTKNKNDIKILESDESGRPEDSEEENFRSIIRRRKRMHVPPDSELGNGTNIIKSYHSLDAICYTEIAINGTISKKLKVGRSTTGKLTYPYNFQRYYWSYPLPKKNCGAGQCKQCLSPDNRQVVGSIKNYIEKKAHRVLNCDLTILSHQAMVIMF